MLVKILNFIFMMLNGVYMVEFDMKTPNNAIKTPINRIFTLDFPKKDA